MSTDKKLQEFSEWHAKKYGSKPHRGYATAEFLAIQPEIEALRQAGHSIKVIYDYMKDMKRINMSYSTFLNQIKNISTTKKNLFSNGNEDKPLMSTTESVDDILNRKI